MEYPTYSLGRCELVCQDERFSVDAAEQGPQKMSWLTVRALSPHHKAHSAIAYVVPTTPDELRRPCVMVRCFAPGVRDHDPFTGVATYESKERTVEDALRVAVLKLRTPHQGNGGSAGMLKRWIKGMAENGDDAIQVKLPPDAGDMR